MVFFCLKSGFAKVMANKRMLLTFYLVNLLFGVLMMLPFRLSFGAFIGDSLMGKALAAEFDYTVLQEFLTGNPGFLPMIIGMVVVMALAYWAVNLFLSGGAISLLKADKSYGRRTFWSHCGVYFGRFLRLALLFLPLLLILLLTETVFLLITEVGFSGDAPGALAYWVSWARVAWRGFMLLVGFAVFDYARIYTIVHNERRMLTSLRRGMGFTFANFRRVMTMSFVFMLFSALLILVYSPIADMLSAPSALVIFSLFLLQQLYMLVRMFLRLALYGGEASLYQRLREQAEAAEPQVEPAPEDPLQPYIDPLETDSPRLA